MSRTGLRPSLSLRAPSTGAATSWHTASRVIGGLTEMATRADSTNRATKNGATGLISVNPAKLKNTDIARMTIGDRIIGRVGKAVLYNILLLGCRPEQNVDETTTPTD